MKQPILVTGIHRSGSTWLGKTISESSKIKYVHEPTKPGIRESCPFQTWFKYMNAGTDKAFQQEVKKYFDSFLSPFSINSRKGYKDLNNGNRNILRYLNDLKNRFTKRPLIKDPIAILASEWIVENYNSQIIIIIRHPAAVVGSIKVKDWKFGFEEFKRQTDLMNTRLKKYKTQVDEYCENPPDIVDQSILQWNMIYDMVYQYTQEHPDWYFVKHEDLSLAPIEEYKKIFEYLKLPFEEKVKRKIVESTKAEEKSRLKRDSKKNIHTWKERLTDEEIKRVYQGTKDIWEKFYTAEDWK